MVEQQAADDLGLRSATELRAMIGEKSLSSRELLAQYRQRIDALDPAINAVVTTDWDRAEKQAEAADAKTMTGGDLAALHGLPLTVKDAIAVAGMLGTGGATELAANVPDQNAPVIDAVEDAGGIVFGKTNLPRWSGDTQAYNELFGTTANPWDLTRGPGGSSGGASAAVAAGLTSFELGTDIGGSVRLPAHFAGVCGHKPSFGIVSQLGYLSHTTGGTSDADVNVFGPLARSVDDLELVLDVIAGPRPDQASAWRLELPPPATTDPTLLRVAAWLDDPVCPVGNDVAELLRGAVAALAGAGSRVDSEARPDIDLSEVWQTGLPLISAATTPSRTADEFARQVATAEDDSVDPTTRMRANASAMRHRDWLLLDERRQDHRRRWANFFQAHDVLLCPVSASAAFPHQPDGNLYTRTIDIDGVERPYADLIAWTSFIGYAYLPSTVVPVGLTPGGLPVGIQVVGPYLGDRSTLAVARMLEQIFGGYQPPPMAQLGTTRESSGS